VRTTITLDADTTQLIREQMRRRNMTFKAAINDAIRRGLAPPRSGPGYRTEAASMGEPRIPLEHALRLAGELEDEELLRKRALGK